MILIKFIRTRKLQIRANKENIFIIDLAKKISYAFCAAQLGKCDVS
jgi:hypothetical protein